MLFVTTGAAGNGISNLDKRKTIFPLKIDALVPTSIIVTETVVLWSALPYLFGKSMIRFMLPLALADASENSIVIVGFSKEYVVERVSDKTDNLVRVPDA